MHSLLARQLKKTGLTDLASGHTPEAWLALLDRVNQSYADADQERYLLERSLNISSREMQELSGSLSAERDRLTAILRSLGDGLCALDSEGRLLLINPQGEQLLGWGEDELVGRDLLATVGASCATEAPGAKPVSLPALVGAGQTYRNEDDSFACKDGTQLPVSYVVTPLATQGRLSGAVLVFRDMTMRKQQLAAQTQLVRRESMLRLARRFASESDPEQVLTDLLDEAVAVLGCHDGTLSRWNAVKGVLVPVRNTVPTANEYTVIEIGAGVSGRAIERRAPVILNDYQKESGIETPAGKAGVRAAVAVPLLHEGRLIGSLSANTYDPARKFTDEDAEVLELLAGLASAALASLERSTELAEANRELKQARDEAQHQALHDGLTGLPNRTLLQDRVSNAILTAQRENTALTLLLVDLDRFKEINDTFGHHYGDLLLQQIGPRLRGVLRASDTIARLGGDEFGILLPTTDAESAVAAAQKLLQRLEAPFELDGQTVEIGASIGVASYPAHGSDAATLLRRADVAMYVAKRGDSGIVVYAAEQDHYSAERLALGGELRRALENNELLLHFQPKLDLRDGTLVGAEALVRWQHPLRGFLPPSEFIPLAEQTGLIYPLTRWVLEAALKQHQAWRAVGIEVPVAVNLSRRTLHDPELPQMVAQLLARWGVAPAGLVLEITEGGLMADPQRARENLTQLRALGVRMSIDDFGTGYSSLASLKNLSVDELKIDQSFIQAMATDASARAIVRAIIDLADALKLRVVAEGVEDRATWDVLAGLGCQVAQGYLLSRPIAATELEAWIADVSPSWLAAPDGSRVEDALQERIRGRGARLTAEEEFIGRKQAEAALGASEERNRLALQAAGMGTWDVDIVHDVHTWSTEAEALSGLAPGTFEGTFAAFRRIVHPDDWLALEIEQRAAQAEHRDSLTTYRTVWPNGSVRWIEAKGRALYAADGALLRVTGTSMDVTERKHTEEALRHQTLHDLLTGLPNRVLLNDRLRQRTTLPSDQQTALALLVIDLDGFKEINDTFGHQYGDKLLAQVGQRWQAVLQNGDTLARLGGDEFAVLLASTSDAEAASLVALRLQQALEDSFILDEQRVNIGASIGIALFPEHGPDAEALLRCADVAMYSAKQSGRTCAVYNASHDHNSAERLALVGELRRAIEDDELVLHFQPQVSLQTGRIIAAEALVRWQHPRRGLLGPNEFIPLAERVLLIEPLTQWVLNAALREHRIWQAAGHSVAVAVNLSMRSFQDPYLPETIEGLLATWDAAPGSLRLEITESSLTADPAETFEVISRLRAMGVRVAVDAFGTVYASLGHLKRLPVDELKIDKSFVGGMATDPKDLAIVRSTIGLAHELGLQVVAEGVEDGASWDLLVQAGCDLAQGYYISRPVSAKGLRRQLGGSSMLLNAA